MFNYLLSLNIAMELTEEQLRRIHENRSKAIGPELFCRRIAEDGENECRGTNIDKDTHDTFNETICINCKQSTDDFDLITKAEAIKTYLVTDDSLSTLKFKCRDNPHHAGWTQMKLYLRKHVKQLSVKRHGSLEKLAELKRIKEAQHFEKNLTVTNNVLTTSTKDLWNDFNSSSIITSNKSGDVNNSDNKNGDAFQDSADINIFFPTSKPNKKRPASSSSSSSTTIEKPVGENTKRRKVALSKLVSIIRGDV